MRPPQSRDLVLLDANVWRYFVDADAIGDLRRASLANKVAVAIAPAVVYEAARTEDPEVRWRLIEAMTMGIWHRLMPEAYEESMELVVEIRRLQHEWLRPNRGATWHGRLLRDWQGGVRGFWHRIRHDPKEVERICSLSEPQVEVARIQAGAARSTSRELGVQLDQVDLSDDVAWRLASLQYYTSILPAEEGPHYEWLSEIVDIDRALGDLSRWPDFWLRHAEAHRMPCAWMRWALEQLFPTQKVSSGTPCDVQLATYLVHRRGSSRGRDVSLFITSDKIFDRLLQRCRRDAPFDMARLMRVEAGERCVEAVLGKLRDLDS